MTTDRTADAWNWGGTDLTPTPHLSMAERIRVAEFDAAPEPPEIAAIAPLLAKLRAVEALADELESESRNVLKSADLARERGDQMLHRVNVRHARIARQAAASICRALDVS